MTYYQKFLDKKQAELKKKVLIFIYEILLINFYLFFSQFYFYIYHSIYRKKSKRNQKEK